MINITSKIPIIGIYKITSPSGKIYIGQSTDINARWDYYKNNLKHCKKQRKLYYSFLKYNFDNHQKEILEECSFEYLDELETWWKHFYGIQCVENGLCCGYYDKGGGPKSEETKRKMSLNGKGKNKGSKSEKTKLKISQTKLKRKIKYSKEICLKISNSNKGKSRGKGKKLSEITKMKMSNIRKGKTKSDLFILKIKKYILQYNLEGNFIKEWSSIKEAGEKLKIHRSGITMCCKDILKTSGGFIWKYKN